MRWCMLMYCCNVILLFCCVVVFVYYRVNVLSYYCNVILLFYCVVIFVYCHVDVLSYCCNAILLFCHVVIFVNCVGVYRLVWAMLKTIASSTILDLWKFLSYHFTMKPPCYFGINRKLMKRPFYWYLGGLWGPKIWPQTIHFPSRAQMLLLVLSWKRARIT